MSLLLVGAAVSAGLAILASHRAAGGSERTEGRLQRIVALVVITLVTVGIVTWVVLMWGFAREFRS